MIKYAALGGLLGASWDLLAASWGLLGLLGLLGASWGLLAAFWGHIMASNHSFQITSNHFKISFKLKNDYMCSTSLPGGNQVDGLPLVLNNRLLLGDSMGSA